MLLLRVSRRTWYFIFVLLFTSIAPATIPTYAQYDVNPPYRRLTDTIGGGARNRDAASPQIAFDSTRQRFLMIYTSDVEPNPNNTFQVYGQLLNTKLEFLEQESFNSVSSDPTPFQISATRTHYRTDPTDQKFEASVAANTISGGYLVVWIGEKPLGGDVYELEVFGRFVDENGIPIASEFQISEQGPPGDYTYETTFVDVTFNAGAGDGEFFVTWKGDAGGTDNARKYEVFGRRISAGGDFQGEPTNISRFGPIDDLNQDADVPVIVSNPEKGEYLVVWNGRLPSGDQEVYARRLAADGSDLSDLVRISSMGPEGDANYRTFAPAAAYNPDDDQYLVAFTGEGLIRGEAETYAQFLDADANEIGPNDFRVSDMGTYGDPRFDAFNADIAYNSASREYLIAWQADDRFDGDREIFAQRIDAQGRQLGKPDQQISFHGPEGSDTYRAGSVAVTASPLNDLFVVLWNSDDGERDDSQDFGLRVDEYEVFGRIYEIAAYVTGVNSIPPTTDGVLSEIEAIDIDITGLSVSFSKDMYNPSGDTEFSDVTNPDNYWLVQTGPNERNDTDSCSAVAKDDLRQPITSVSYNALARQATVTIGNTLDAGTYRLLVCNTLRDNRGQLIDGTNTGNSSVVFTRDFTIVGEVDQSWLILLYLAGDDIDPNTSGPQISLTGPIRRLVDRLATMPYNDSARIVALYDGKVVGDSRIYVREADGMRDVTDIAMASPLWPAFPSDKELDTGNYQTLQSFILWARTTYAGADYTMLSIVNHGGGWAPELDLDPAQPRGRVTIQNGAWRGMSIDMGTPGGSSFSTQDTGQAFGELQAFGEFDIIFFDACLMGMVESAFEIYQYTDYFIAGQNLLWSELPYDQYLAKENLNGATTPRALAKRIVELYNADPDGSSAAALADTTPDQPFTLAAIDTRGERLQNVAGLLNALARHALSELNAGGERATRMEQLLRDAYSAAQKFDYDSSFVIDPTDGYVDLADFARRLDLLIDQLDGQSAPDRVQSNAAALYNLLAETESDGSPVIARRSVNGTFVTSDAQYSWNFASAYGLSVYMPLGERDERPTSANGQPERQLAYYASQDDMLFSREVQAWVELLERLEATTPARDLEARPFNAPFPLGVSYELYLPLLER
jgi:hypothetical protein